MLACEIIKPIMPGISYGPFGVFSCAWRNRKLIARLAKREVEARYRGSMLGLVWLLLIPLMMLGVYIFVFSMVFQVRWETPVGGRGEFALLLFSGLIVFTIFAECVNRAPGLMLENVTYIKKVVFPLEIMPWVTMAVALFNATVSLFVLFLFYLVLHGLPPLTALLLPVMLLPLVLLTLGLAWFLASLGVFLRDIRQLTGVATTIFLFLSPIFYPITAVPEAYRIFIYLNPLTLVLEKSRVVLFWGEMPNWGEWVIYTAIAWLLGWLGYVWFMRTKKGFADVV